MSISNIPNRVQILKAKFTQSLGLPFQEILSESMIGAVLDELKIKYRCRVFDPIVTNVGVFISSIRY